MLRARSFSKDLFFLAYDISAGNGVISEPCYQLSNELHTLWKHSQGNQINTVADVEI